MEPTDNKHKKKPRYQTIDGYTIPEIFSVDALRSTLAYKPQDDDLFVVTFPKCGTTWTQNIVFLILNEGKPLKSYHDFLIRTPFLELCGAEAVATMPRPGAIKIHLPFQLTPYSPSAKYIYVSRNPKDTCVSFYHHTRSLAMYEFEGNFDDFFEVFYNGENDFGEYFMHTLSWYDHRNDPNVLFLTYEEMKKDTRNVIMKMAKFLGIQYETMLIKHPQVMENILKHSSAESMKKNMKIVKIDPSEMPEDLPEGLKHVRKIEEERGLIGKSDFNLVRKGIVGDWQNYFTKQQAKKLDDKTREKLAGTDLLKYWQSLGILE